MTPNASTEVLTGMRAYKLSAGLLPGLAEAIQTARSPATPNMAVSSQQL